MNDARAQAIALAAVAEAARQVDLLARTGRAGEDAEKMLRESLFSMEWRDPAEIFGGADRLRPGIGLLLDMLDGYAHETHGQILRYILAILHLGRILQRDRARLATIRQRLGEAPRDADDAGLETHIAGIYQQTVSTCRYRIQVTGNAAHLQDPRIARRIRVLLLAGLRAAVLWRFVGGSRRATLFGRRRIVAACRELLAMQ